MAATPRSGPTVFLACPALSSSSSSNGQSAISPVFSRQIRKTLVSCCAKKSRSEKQKLEEMSALYSGSLSDKRKGKLLKSLSMDLSAVSATLHQPHFCAEEIDKSLVDQVRRQILEGAVDVLKTQLDQARKEYRERKQQLKTNKKKNS